MAVNTQAAPGIEQTVAKVSRPPGQKPQRAAYLYLFPVVVSALLFTILPFVYTLYISFTNYDRTYHSNDFGWIGSDNYTRVFETGSSFYPVLGWTAFFMIATTVFNVGGGMVLAMMLNHSRLKERNVYRTLLILPWALPNILLIQVWAGMYNRQGPINQVLETVGIEGPRWLTTPETARAAVLFTNLWLSYPFFMTIGLAALQAIPRDLYEVADLDGASSWPKFRDITFPFLLSAITPLLLTQLAFQFNNAGIIILLTGGAPQAFAGARYGVTDTLATFAYKLIYDDGEFGFAAAYGVVIFVIIAAFILVSSRVTKSFEEAT